MKRPRGADVVLTFAVLCLVGAVAYRVSSPSTPDPKAAYAEARARPILSRGEMLPEFWRDLGWSAPPAGPTLVIFYTVECPYCRMSVRRWNLLNQAVGTIPHARSVAVALSDSAESLEYPRQTGLAYPIHLPASGRALEQRWKVQAVPYTVLLAPDGLVHGAWKGQVDSMAFEVISSQVKKLSAGSGASRE